MGELCSRKSIDIATNDNRNEQLQNLENEIADMTLNCARLERQKYDCERLFNEQSELMKALNVRIFYLILYFCGILLLLLILT